MKYLSLALIFFLTVATSFASIKPPKGYHKTVYNSTFALYGQLGDITHFLCTATAFEKTSDGYHLLTASHCVKGADLPEDLQFFVEEQIGGLQLPVTVIKAMRKEPVDIAVLELKTGKEYKIIPLGTEEGVQIGDKVFSVNFSEGLSKQLSEGIVASDVMGTEVEDCHTCTNRFMVQIYGGPGMSGAAVVSEKTHKIVGIVTSGFDANVGAGVEPISLYQVFLDDKVD